MRTILAPNSAPQDRRPLQLMGGACSRKAARVVHALIVPAPAEGNLPAGQVDDQGFGLHLQYAFNAADVVPHVDYPGVKELDQSHELFVRFGPGTHYLNHGGEVALVGGKGLWRVDIQVTEVDTTHPHWHWLLRRVANNQTFQLPSRHTMVGCYNGSAVLKVNDGTVDLSLVVGSPPVPVVGGLDGTATMTSSGSGDEALWVYTGWFG